MLGGMTKPWQSNGKVGSRSSAITCLQSSTAIFVIAGDVGIVDRGPKVPAGIGVRLSSSRAIGAIRDEIKAVAIVTKPPTMASVIA
jgi:hypothetical protein